MNKETAETLSQEIKSLFPYVKTVVTERLDKSSHIIGVYFGEACFTLSNEQEWREIQSMLPILFPYGPQSKMNAYSYQHSALETLNHKLLPKERLGMLALGLTGESGEVADIIKKFLYHDKPLDTAKLLDELGDVLWYLTVMCAHFGVTLEEIMKMNSQKLLTRHKDGFTNTYSSDSGYSEK